MNYKRSSARVKHCLCACYMVRGVLGFSCRAIKGTKEMLYRGYHIDWERDHRGEIRTLIIDPNGEGWYCDGDPEDEIDELVDGHDEDYHEEHRLRGWQLA